MPDHAVELCQLLRAPAARIRESLLTTCRALQRRVHSTDSEVCGNRLWEMFIRTTDTPGDAVEDTDLHLALFLADGPELPSSDVRAVTLRLLGWSQSVPVLAIQPYAGSVMTWFWPHTDKGRRLALDRVEQICRAAAPALREVLERLDSLTSLLPE